MGLLRRPAEPAAARRGLISEIPVRLKNELVRSSQVEGGGSFDLFWVNRYDSPFPRFPKGDASTHLRGISFGLAGDCPRFGTSGRAARSGRRRILKNLEH